MGQAGNANYSDVRTPDKHITRLGLATYGLALLLLASYGWYRKRLSGTIFFTVGGDNELNNTRLLCSNKTWVLLGAGGAFLCNLIFIGLITFDPTAWDESERDSLTVTLCLQMLYYYLQLFYIPSLLYRKKRGAQVLLGVCALLQSVSAIIAFIRGSGVSQYINMGTALWTTGFDFVTHACIPECTGLTVCLDNPCRMSLFDSAASSDLSKGFTW